MASSPRRVSSGSTGPNSGAAPVAFEFASPPVTTRSGNPATEPFMTKAAADGNVRGRVETPAHEPIPGAVVAFSAGPLHQDIAAYTDEDGCFSLPTGSPGAYEVTARKAGYGPHSVRVNSAEGNPLTLVLRATADG
jgi:hypothetical protein